MPAFYNPAIIVYGWLIRLAAPFSRKAALWRNGRKDFFKRYGPLAATLEGCIWIHCASLGEFEQGRPLIDMIRRERPDEKILLTFFSPSGYEIRKDYPAADLVTYLPLDTPRNARRFTELFRPSRAIFVKYEFWHHHIRAARKNNIPVYLVSGIFREDQYFFRWWGSPFRKTLELFTHFFVQDEASAGILRKAGFENYTVTGDTRVDRVAELPVTPFRDAVTERFLQDEKALIVGSSWPEDDKIVLPALAELTKISKVIIVPHDPDAGYVKQLAKSAGQPVALHSRSAFPGYAGSERILIIDSVGLLGKMYRYAWLAYIGGGFGKGIHNILEPAAYHIPVLFGPRYTRFPEAVQLTGSNLAFCVRDSRALKKTVAGLHSNKAQLSDIHKSIAGFIQKSKGATKIVYDAIFLITAP